jgi:hypothetical protein
MACLIFSNRDHLQDISRFLQVHIKAHTWDDKTVISYTLSITRYFQLNFLFNVLWFLYPGSLIKIKLTTVILSILKRKRDCFLTRAFLIAKQKRSKNTPKRSSFKIDRITVNKHLFSPCDSSNTLHSRSLRLRRQELYLFKYSFNFFNELVILYKNISLLNVENVLK